jgi:small subunit ribosomal protein S6
LRTYEALYIVKPDLKDDEIQTVAKDVETLVTSSGGAIVRSETWGKRKMAYEVDRYTEGVYVLLRFQSPANFVGKLANHFRLTESIIRDIIVYFDDKTLRLEEEQKVRVEAELRANAARTADRDDDDDDDDDRRPQRGRRRDDDDDE